MDAEQNMSLGPSVIWRNWVSNQVCRVQNFYMPSSNADAAAAVRAAAAAKKRIRVVGGGHSYSPIVPTEGVLFSLERMSGIESIDRENGLVTLGGGTRISDAGPDLRAAGLALANQGDIDVQSYAGALATGTHGSGDTLKCLSGAITGMRIAIADGSIIELDECNDPQALKAAQVSMGMLGIVLAVTMKMVPAYDLHERVWRADFESCVDDLEGLCRENRNVRVFWCHSEHSGSLFGLPDTAGVGTTKRRSDVCEVRTLNATSNSPESVHGIPGERIGPSYRIFPALPMPNHNECEYAVPFEDGIAVFREIRKLIQAKHTSQLFPVEFRSVAADDIYLSPSYGRKTAWISVSAGAGEDYWDFIRDCEAIFAAARGRPHWGKLHSLGRDQIRDLYPRYDAFVAQRRRFDPDGRFLNDYLAERFS